MAYKRVLLKLSGEALKENSDAILSADALQSMAEMVKKIHDAGVQICIVIGAGNQVVSATSLMAATVWLLRSGRRWTSLVTLLPGAFMTVVVASFILWTPGTGGQPWGLVPGGLPLWISIVAGVLVAAGFAFYVFKRSRKD